jgi:hypothetical protein
MDFNCSHCSQPLSIADEEIAALRGRASIACPSCGGKIVLPKPQRSLAPSPVRAPGQLKPVPHAPAAAPAKAAKPAKPKKPRLPIDPAKLQRNILILGCTALLMLGGIAGFLATREAGKTVHIEQKIINKLIENEYFQRLIRDGKTTPEALVKIEDAYPYGKGFIGVSRVDYDWGKAQELARTTASEILDVATSARQSRRELGDWIAEKIPALKNHPVWVRDLSTLAVLDAPDLLSNATDRPRRVLLIWPASEPWPNKGWAWAVKPEFEAVEAFDAATGLARAKSGGRWGLINLKGEWVLKPQYDRIGRFSSRQSAQITLTDASGQEKHGLVDHTGRVVTAPEWEEVQDLIHDFVPVQRGGKWGYLDANGKQVIPNEWDDAWRFSSLGYAVVIRNGKRGVVDRAGKLVIQPQWDGLFNFSREGIGAARMGKDYGLITPSGSLLTPVEFDTKWLQRTLDIGLVSLAKKDGKLAVVGVDGKPASGFEGAEFIQAIETPRGPMLRVTWPDGVQSLQEQNGKELFRTKGKGIVEMFGKDGLAFVEDERGGGYIDALGRLSIPLSPEQKRPPPPAYRGRGSYASSQRHYGSDYGALPPGWSVKTVASKHLPSSPYWHRFVRTMPNQLWPIPDLLAVDNSIVLTGMNEDHAVLDDLIPYAAPPKYGLIDTAGKVLVEPTWDEARVLSRDWVLIRVGHRYGLANGAGKVIVEPAWDDIKVPFASYVSLAADGKTVQLGLDGTRFQAPWILAYQKGRVTVLLPDGKAALPEKIGNAPVKYVDFYGPSRLVISLQELTGPVLAIFEPKTGDLVRFPDASTFIWNWNSAEAGLIWMKDGKATTELWRLMDRKGKALGYTRTEEPWGWGFVEDRALHPIGDGWIFIDKAGQVIGGDKPWQEAHDFSEGLAAVKRDGRWGFIGLDGKLVVEPVWKEAHDFHHGRAAVLGMDTSFWGYLAPDGSVAMAALWTKAEDFTEWIVHGSGETLSMSESTTRYDSAQRRWLTANDLPWQGEKTERIRGGSARHRQVALVYTGRAWSLVDRDGFMLADPVTGPEAPSNYWLKEDVSGQISLVKREIAAQKGNSVRWLDATTAWVRMGRSSSWTLHDHTGRQLSPTIWTSPPQDGGLDPFSSGLITVQDREGRQALLRPDGSTHLPLRYERIAWVAPAVAAAWSGSEGGLVDAQGKWLFQDDNRRRIARFGTKRFRETPDELRHGLVVIEDLPKWGHARLNRP